MRLPVEIMEGKTVRWIGNGLPRLACPRLWDMAIPWLDPVAACSALNVGVKVERDSRPDVHSS